MRRTNSSIHKEDKKMKEKRILAMFITSVVTLVASLAVTFGILTTLADPVEATAVTRYAFAFNDVNGEGITVDGSTLTLTDDIYFTPSDELRWNEFEKETDTDPMTPILINGTAYDESIQYFDESVASRVKLIPFRLTNKHNDNAIATISIEFDKSTQIGTFTKVKFFDYQENKFVDGPSITRTLSANESLDFVAVVYVDQSANFTSNKLVFTGENKQSERINLKITNQSIYVED